MMLKVNKLLSGVLALSILCSTSAVLADGVVTQTADAEKTVFDAKEAVSYMLENSLELKAAQENIEYLELKVTADAGLRRRINNKGAAGTVNDINTMLAAGGYVEFTDEKQIAIAKRTLGDTKYKLTMQLENKFYSCLNADRKINVAKQALDNAIENERIAKAREEAGQIGSIEASSFSVAVIHSQNDYDDAVRSRDYMYIELKQLMGYPADKDIKLTGSFERQPMSTVALNTAVASVDKTANKLNLDAGLEIQARLLNEYKALYTSSMADYKAQKYAYAKAESEYNDNIGKLRLAVMSTYNTMQTTYGTLNYLDKSIELKEQQVEAKRTAYELGLSTASEYITSVQELDSLRLSLVDAEIGAYLTSKAYEMTFHPAE